MTYNQEVAFEEIKKSGGTVVGAGKGEIFTSGYSIPASTHVEAIRPD